MLTACRRTSACAYIHTYNTWCTQARTRADAHTQTGGLAASLCTRSSQSTRPSEALAQRPRAYRRKPSLPSPSQRRLWCCTARAVDLADMNLKTCHSPRCHEYRGWLSVGGPATLSQVPVAGLSTRRQAAWSDAAAGPEHPGLHRGLCVVAYRRLILKARSSEASAL
jgi:hypothetical protein